MIPEKNPYNNWKGNGNTTTFDFDFYIEDETQLVVYHTNSKGVQTTLKYGTDYSINELKNENGSFITFPLDGSAYETLKEDEVISLCLTLPISQENEYGKSSYLDLKAIEYSLDYLTRICQIINRQMERSVKTQEGSSQSASELIEALQDAQVNASASAAAAQASAQAAYNSAIAAGEEATEATQKAAEVDETYNQAMKDIEEKRQQAINEIETTSSGALNEYNYNAENKSSSLDQQYNDASSNLEKQYQEESSNLEKQFNEESSNLEQQYTEESTNLKEQYESYTDNLSNEYQATMKAYDRLYKGIDLSIKFAKEIEEAGNIYAWLEQRKNAGNYDGIHIGDYFYLPVASGTVNNVAIPACEVRARIVGLNTYKNCADTLIGNMIYIHTDHCFGPFLWNPEANNNGTSTTTNPWLASAIYAVLNGVNNYSTSAYNKVPHGANCSGKGLLQLLPSELRAVMKQQRVILDDRYSASGLLTGGTGWTWQDKGLLVLPCEVEVYNTQFKSNTCQTAGWWNPENNLSIQFPWYANNCENRVKYIAGTETSRCNWWLSSVASDSASTVCAVGYSGSATSYSATYAAIYAPLCFCI